MFDGNQNNMEYSSTGQVKGLKNFTEFKGKSYIQNLH